MFTFSANLGFLFRDLPFTERIAAAARAGLPAVELPHSGVPAKELAAAAKAAGVFIAQFNAPSGAEEPGVNGLCTGKNRGEQFAAAIDAAIETARVFGDNFGKRVHVLSGLPEKDGDESDDILEARMTERVRHAADRFAEHGLTLLLEPINRFDMPGYFLHDMNQGLRMIEKVGRDNVQLQYDIYHAQRTRGELTAFLRDHIGRIGHIQVADNPGRRHPGTGEINYPFLFEELLRLDYDGWIGLEYVPEKTDAETFRWIRDMNLESACARR